MLEEVQIATKKREISGNAAETPNLGKTVESLCRCMLGQSFCNSIGYNSIPAML